MRIFLFASFLIFALVRVQAEPCDNTCTTVTPDSLLPWHPVFGKEFEKSLYRATLDISKHHLTGYLFIKKAADTSFRILFNNDFGMQIFDFEFRNKEFIAHYCFPSMDRKSLLKLLETDFRMLIFPNDDIVKIKEEKSSESDQKVFIINMKSGKWLYRVSAASKEIISIHSKGKTISKTALELERNDESSGKIRILNPFIKLKFIMNPMEQ
jgi:hypothetical protein